MDLKEFPDDASQVFVYGPYWHTDYGDENTGWVRTWGLTHTVRTSLLFLEFTRDMSRRRHWWSRAPPPRRFELPEVVDIEAETDYVA